MTISKVFTEKKPITAKTIVDKALSFIGTYDGGNNNVIFNTDYYGKEVSGSNFPWCAAFLWDIFRMCNAEKLFCDGAKTAYCPYIHSWGQRSGQLISQEYYILSSTKVNHTASLITVDCVQTNLRSLTLDRVTRSKYYVAILSIQINFLFSLNRNLRSNITTQTIYTLFAFNKEGSTDQDRLREGDELEAEVRTIDERSYEYLYSLLLMDNTGTNPIENFTGGCLGYFSAFSGVGRGIEFRTEYVEEE